MRLITITPDYFGLSARHIELARQVSSVARELGIPGDPSSVPTVPTVQVTIDALDLPAVMSFWRAVLGYQD